MTVYVDNVRIKATVGRITARWSHMTADTDVELHVFAALLGLKREWFQNRPDRPEANHYDVTDQVRTDAIRLGAVAEDWRDGARRRRAKGKERADAKET